MRSLLFVAAIAVAAAAGIRSSPSIGQTMLTSNWAPSISATSCNETAQRRFDRAMRYQHSFWYKASKEIFEEMLKADPKCGIAYWGIALGLARQSALCRRPRPTCHSASRRFKAAKAIGAKTQRERDFIDALALLYVDYDKTTQARRVQSYLKAMEALAARYPDDDEAQILYAITLNVAASPTDKTYAKSAQGSGDPGADLQAPAAASGRRPLSDSPLRLSGDRARSGLDAARRYAEIAPAAPHALHMPSHIFTRVGYWKKSIAVQHRLGDAAKAEKSITTSCTRRTTWSTPICSSARTRRRARRRRMPRASIENLRVRCYYARAAIPARYTVDRGDWKGAAGCRSSRKYPHVMAIAYFARALGAARSGNPQAASADIARIAEMRDQLSEAKDAYWSQIVGIQHQVVTAWQLYAEGKYDEALAMMSAASDAEDKTEKHPVTPGPVAPARELYGTMLLDRGMASEALAAFEASMAKEPNRFNGIAGAAQAAVTLGDSAKAKALNEKLVALASAASDDRPALAEARAFLAKN